MSVIDPAELLLAVTGISPFIDGKPPRITIEMLKKAREIPQQIVDRARAVCKGELKHTPIPRPHSYTALLDRLTQPLPPHELEQMELTFAPDEHDLSTRFTVLVQHVYKQIQSIFPLAVVQSYAGARNITPNDDRIFQFFNQFSLLNDPMRVFDLIGSGSLLRSQSRAMRAIYVTLAPAIDEAINEAVTEESAASADHKAFHLPPRVEYGVSVWTGKRAIEFKPPEPPPSAPPGAPKTPDLQTSAQKAQGS